MSTNHKGYKHSKKAVKKKPVDINKILVAGGGILALIVIVVLIITNIPKAAKDTDLIINRSGITNKASFYPVVIEGTKLEVLAVKAPDGSTRTAFNTCQVCYSSGRGYYKQEGNALVCQNCGNRFGMGDVGLTSGGCNPVPITPDKRTITGNEIIISKQFLTESKYIFENWKK